MNKSKPALIAIKLLITAAVGLIYFYIKLPAINLKDYDFYTFIFILSAVYCLLSLVTVGVYRVANPLELFSVLKQNSLSPPCSAPG